MCGIAGIYGMEDIELIKKMCNVLKHRGPDDVGIYNGENVTLGHTRLSIIDLKKGHQPISNEDESIWIVFNGEIYNFKEIRKELEKKGHRFYTNTDTEVVVHAYEEYGIACVEKFIGMFAFAIFDSNKEELFLARDRLGIKPLYYTFLYDSILFASEIKALIQHEEVKKQIDLRALNDFITLRYIPAPRTIFRSIKKLPPGYIMIVNPGRMRKIKYWDVSFNLKKLPEKQYAQRILDLLKDSVKLRMMSDVPLGAYLSGGVDSSTVVALMNSIVDEPLRTFSVGFGEETDELKYAAIMAEHFETDHYEIVVDAEDAFKVLKEVVWHLDEPLADMASIPMYFLSKLAKKHVKVVLTGEGGDELFAGYEKYKILINKRLIHHKISNITSIWHLNSIFPDHIAEYLRYLKSAEGVYLWDNSIFRSNERKKLYIHPDLIKDLEHNSLSSILNKNVSNYNLVNKYFYIDLKVWLPDELLMKVDKMTMANSIEARVPFLDHRLVEFAMKIPLKFKIKNNKEKYILREAVKGVLPKEILYRRKQGFTVPKAYWIQTGLKDLISELLSEETIKRQGFFNYESIQKLLKNHEKNSQKILTLLIFGLWYKIYIEEGK